MKKSLQYFLLISIAVMVLLYFFVGTTSDICKRHRHLYFADIKKGVVIGKLIDFENHSIETIIIRENDTVYELLLVPEANDPDFDYIKVNDFITKPANSFVFTVNNKYEFEFLIDCDYE